MGNCTYLWVPIRIADLGKVATCRRLSTGRQNQAQRVVHGARSLQTTGQRGHGSDHQVVLP